MNAKAKSVHTKGNLEIIGAGTSSPLLATPDGNGGFYYIAQIYREPDIPEYEKQANAQRLVKCWNMHSEAMDIILGLLRESKSSDSEIVKMAMDLLNRDELKKIHSINKSQ